jgi:ABC-type nitrate/sulfonate/bicarbonate transport system permease component
MKQRNSPRSILVGIVMFLVLWQIASVLMARPILPPPTVVLPIFFRLMPGELGLHFLYSLYRVLAAVALSTLLAVPTGLILGQLPQLDRIFNPLIAIIYPVPKIILMPIIYVLFGISDASKIFLITLILFFQTLVVVRDQAATLRPELIFSVRSLGAGGRALLRYVYFPAALPVIVTSLRISISLAIAVLFITEQSLTTKGLGYFIIVKTYSTLRYPEMYAGILAMSLLGSSLFFTLDWLERYINRHLFAS